MRPLFLLWGCLVLPGYGSLVGPKEISGFEGDTVTLTCSYGEEQKGFSKYWCRDVGIIVSRCSTIYYASEDGRASSRDRVSILDSRRNLTLTVTLRALSQQDTGSYMCGISRMGFDHTFRVLLHVFSGTSHLATQSGPTSAKDANLIARSSSSSETRVPLVRILAPVLVLLTLLLFVGLVAVGRCVLRWKKEAQLAEDTLEKEKVQLSHVAMGNSWVPEYSVISLAGPTEPGTSAKPPTCPYTEVQRLNQNSEQGEVSFQGPEQAVTPGSPLHASGQESGFVPV